MNNRTFDRFKITLVVDERNVNPINRLVYLPNSTRFYIKLYSANCPCLAEIFQDKIITKDNQKSPDLLQIMNVPEVVTRIPLFYFFKKDDPDCGRVVVRFRGIKKDIVNNRRLGLLIPHDELLDPNVDVIKDIRILPVNILENKIPDHEYV